MGEAAELAGLVRQLQDLTGRIAELEHERDQLSRLWHRARSVARGVLADHESDLSELSILTLQEILA